MLVGPGGVIALVVGAWAGMWAVRAVPGRRFAVWYPAVVAFLGAILAFALLSAEAEAAVQLRRWAAAAAHEQPAIARQALSMVARPLVGAALGLLLLLSGLAIAWSDTEPVGVHVELRPHVIERVAVVAILALLVIDLWTWFSLRQILASVTLGQGDVDAADAAMRARNRVGVVTNVAVLVLAAGIGLFRQSRRPEATLPLD